MQVNHDGILRVMHIPKDSLAGRCRSNDLREVLRVWRCQKNGLDRGICEDRFDAFREREIMRDAEISRAFSIWLDRMRNP